MKKLASNVCYGIGEVISWPMCSFEHMGWLYPAYNWFMLTSFKLDGKL